MRRPMPPKELLGHEWGEDFLFEPEPDINDWLHTNILNIDSPLYNPDHEHWVEHSGVCLLWAENSFKKQECAVLVQAEIIQFQVSECYFGSKCSGL